MGATQVHVADSIPNFAERYSKMLDARRSTSVDGDILMPGEIEERTKAQRQREGIEIDETTWSQIAETAKSVGLNEGFDQ